MHIPMSKHKCKEIFVNGDGTRHKIPIYQYKWNQSLHGLKLITFFAGKRTVEAIVSKKPEDKYRRETRTCCWLVAQAQYSQKKKEKRGKGLFDPYKDTRLFMLNKESGIRPVKLLKLKSLQKNK